MIIDLEWLKSEVGTASQQLTTSLNSLCSAINRQNLADNALKAHRNKILVDTPDPKVLGSNEATREATLKEMTANEVIALDTASTSVQTLRNQVAVDEIRMKQLGMYLEIAKLERAPGTK